jgi:hypothetical protein
LFSISFYPFYFAPSMHLYTFFRTSIVFCQTRYRFIDPPNSSAVDFVPYVTYFSSRRIALFYAKLTSRLEFIVFPDFTIQIGTTIHTINIDANIPIHALQVTPWYWTLVVLELQFYSFALSRFLGKLWWIGPLYQFSSLGTVSIVWCSTCLYWAFRFIQFLLTRLRVLITLLFFAASIIRTTVGSIFPSNYQWFHRCLL